MIRVLDEKSSINFYQTAFGLTVTNRKDFETFTLVYLRNTESTYELELTINKDRVEPYTHGDGYGHIAFCVDNVDDEYARLIEAGLSPSKVTDFNNNNELIARFFFITDPDGYEIEVLEKFGHYQ